MVRELRVTSLADVVVYEQAVAHAAPTFVQPLPVVEQKLPPFEAWSFTLPVVWDCTFSLKYITTLPPLVGKAALEPVLAVSPIEAVMNAGASQSLASFIFLLFLLFVLVEDVAPVYALPIVSL